MNKVRVFVTGDTHNMLDWAKLNTSNFPEQKQLTKDDIVIITGDAGIVWDQDEQDEYVQSEYNKRNFTTAFVDGNHDNHDALDKYPVEIWNGGKIHRISESIIHLMRGQVYTIKGKKFFTMGGAESTDKAYRKEGESWWAREMPSDEEYEEALKNLKKNRYVVDYVITHCAPEGITGIKRKENKLTRFFDSLIEEYDLEFDKWFCGHYHVDRNYEDIEVLYDSVINLGEMKLDIGYKDDEIFLLSSDPLFLHHNEIPPLACWWWALSPRTKKCFAVPWNGYTNEGYELDSDDFCAVRPVIKYSNIKDRLIKSPDCDELFYFNNHTFKILDSEFEIAIAVMPIAFDYFDTKSKYYEDSSIRAKLLEWFKTGIWNYESEEDIRSSVCKRDLFKRAVDVILNYNEASITLLMQKLGVDHKNAEFLIEKLEKRGIIGAFEGPKSRRVLISKPRKYSITTKVGFKEDPIFLLSVYEFKRYKDYIPLDINLWWLRDCGGKSDNAAYTDGIGQECAYSTILDPLGIRPALKYSNLKDVITMSSRCDERFVFNDHPFRIIDSDNEIAIAEVPIAQFHYDRQYNRYESSDVRRKLLAWFKTGIWEYDLRA